MLNIHQYQIDIYINQTMIIDIFIYQYNIDIYINQYNIDIYIYQ